MHGYTCDSLLALTTQHPHDSFTVEVEDSYTLTLSSRQTFDNDCDAIFIFNM